MISETDRRFSAAIVPARLPESAASPDTATAARSIVLRRVTPSSAIASLRDVLPAATYIPDDRRRAVVIVANAGTVNLAGRLIKSADQPERRVLFDIRLFDVRLIVEEDNLGQELSDAPTPGVQTAMYAFVKDTHRLDSELRFLIGAGRAQALANWRLSVDVGEPAEVAVGERPTPLHSVDIGARLSAKAAIEGRTLFLEVHSAYRVPERFTRGAAVFANRDAAFNLRLRPDQSVVIGGLLKDVDSATIRSAPSLEQLPVLGAVFSNRRRAHIKDEACFVVTPRLAERGSSGS